MTHPVDINDHRDTKLTKDMTAEDFICYLIEQIRRDREVLGRLGLPVGFDNMQDDYQRGWSEGMRQGYRAAADKADRLYKIATLIPRCLGFGFPSLRDDTELMSRPFSDEAGGTVNDYLGRLHRDALRQKENQC